VGGRITAIERASEGSARVAVFVDGNRAFTVSEDVAARLGLAVGIDLGETEIASIESNDGISRAREKALALLAVRARSRRELTDRLKRSGHEPGAVEAVIANLEVSGLVDDVAFARAWADERVRLRPSGRRRLESELIGKGVPRDVIARVLEETFTEHTELELAVQAASKRTRRFGGALPAKERKRLHAFLVRRGFGHEVATTVVRELTKEHDGGADDVG